MTSFQRHLALLLAAICSTNAFADSWRSALVSRSATAGPGGTVVAGDRGGGDDNASPLLAGNVVLYQSKSTNLVDGQVDANNANDVFLFDRTTGINTLVSHSVLAPDRTGNGNSFVAALSADGRWCLFGSTATDLIAGQQSGLVEGNLFLYDATTRTTTLVSHAAGIPNKTANGQSGDARMSRDGRWILFITEATNLVASVDDVNGSYYDVYLYDRLSGSSALMSYSATSSQTTSNGLSFPRAVSDDGRWVAMSTYSTDFPGASPDYTGGVFLRDRQSGTTIAVAASDWAAMSADGSKVAVHSSLGSGVAGFSNPTGSDQALLFDRDAGSATLLSHTMSSTTTGANDLSSYSFVSADGNLISFRSTATDMLPGLVNHWDNIYVHERATGQLQLVNHVTGSETTPSGTDVWIYSSSDNGEFVTYISDDHNLIPGMSAFGASNLFIYEHSTRVNRLVSAAAGIPTQGANGASGRSAVSPDGRIVAFNSRASDLAAATTDTNGALDVFLSVHQYSVNVVASAGGTVTPAGPVDVDAGQSLDLLVTPGGGHVATVTCSCGGTLASSGYLTTDPIERDCAVNVSFPTAPDAVFRDDFE